MKISLPPSAHAIVSCGLGGGTLLVPDDERDDEAIFWERFFERLQPIREAGGKVIQKVDSSPIGDAVDYVDYLLNAGSKRGHAIAQRLTEFWYSAILRSPGLIVALLVIATVLVSKDAIDFGQQIDKDVEIYLPDDADSTDLLKQVRKSMVYRHYDSLCPDK
ncbi:MAG: hypothetical protein Ct9H90mP23_1720 [Methanobacteriota archaeon]|nr:MAG: hypothetical protein Ct9H90mP23_1720 [Euryarchaeota archaeon]